MVFLNFLGKNKMENKPRSYAEMSKIEIERVVRDICAHANSATEIMNKIKEKLKFDGQLDLASSVDGHTANIFMQTPDKKLLEFHAKTKIDIAQN